MVLKQTPFSTDGNSTIDPFIVIPSFYSDALNLPHLCHWDVFLKKTKNKKQKTKKNPENPRQTNKNFSTRNPPSAFLR